MKHKEIENTRGFTQTNVNVVICPPCGESAAGAAKEGQNRKNTLWPLLPRLTAVLPPQGREMFQGFTLIELLVVVLIIGILAAVALPQYNKAVKKAQGREVLVALDALDKALQTYYLEHGDYIGVSSDILNINIPSLTHFQYVTGYNGQKYSYDKNPRWDCSAADCSIFIHHQTHAGNVFEYDSPDITVFFQEGKTQATCSGKQCKEFFTCNWKERTAYTCTVGREGPICGNTTVQDCYLK